MNHATAIQHDYLQYCKEALQDFWFTERRKIDHETRAAHGYTRQACRTGRRPGMRDRTARGLGERIGFTIHDGNYRTIRPSAALGPQCIAPGSVWCVNPRVPPGIPVTLNAARPCHLPLAVTGSAAQGLHAAHPGRCAERQVKRGQRQATALRDLQAGCIVDRQLEALRQTRNRLLGPVGRVEARMIGRSRSKAMSRSRLAPSIRRRLSATIRPFRASNGHSIGAPAPVSVTRSNNAMTGAVCSSSKHQARATELSSTKLTNALQVLDLDAAERGTAAGFS